MSDQSRQLNASYYEGEDETTEIQAEEEEADRDIGLEDEDEVDEEDPDDAFEEWTRANPTLRDEEDMEQNDLEEDDEEEEEEEPGEDINPYAEPNHPSVIKSTFFPRIRKFEAKGLFDIGNLASWDVSSSKQGFGKEALRDDNPDTYWQSDGPQPHTITVHFAKRVAIHTIAIFTNYLVDESYTPSEILIKAGTHEHDLLDVVQLRLKEPSGWSTLGFKEVLKTFMVKIIIKSNHQNGKDTHIRSLKIFQHVDDKGGVAYSDTSEPGFKFSTIKMLSESTIR